MFWISGEQSQARNSLTVDDGDNRSDAAKRASLTLEQEEREEKCEEEVRVCVCVCRGVWV